MRKRVQTRMFGYLLGHSPRYFQENFAASSARSKEAARLHLDHGDGLLRFDQDQRHADRVDGAADRAGRPLAVLLGTWMVVY